MIYSSHLVNAVAFLAICGAVLLSPVYGLWVFIGSIADKRGQRRALAVLKGEL